jgi:hypothetical protein
LSNHMSREGDNFGKCPLCRISMVLCCENV